MKIEYLSWDCEFFGRKIGRVIFNSGHNFVQVLQQARDEGYELLYVFTEPDISISENILADFNGNLADKKVLYKSEIDSVLFYPVEVTEYFDKTLHPDIENLAYVSGQFSRFKLDSNFKESDFYNMYKEWILKSIDKQIADKVLVIRDRQNRIEGMVTLKCKDKIGEIGLIAVSDNAQGKGYGRKLILAAKHCFFSMGINTLEVPTQQANHSACSFYEKCGFNVKSITNIYHFWL